MTSSLYMSTIEPGTGKVVVSLALIEQALRKTTRVGFFRPVIQNPLAGKRDEDIDLMLRHFGLAQSYAASYALLQTEVTELISCNRMDELIEKLIHAYKRLEAQCDFIFIEGTDFLGQASALEFDLNCVMARNLSAPVLIVGNAHGRKSQESLDAMRIAVDAYEEKGCLVAGLVLNKAAAESLPQLQAQLMETYAGKDKVIGVLPYEPSLERPTVREVAEHLGARVLFGQSRLDHSVSAYLIAAMHLQHALERLESDQIVMVPGDRADMLAGLIQADRSINYPRLSGIILTCGMHPAPSLVRLIEGLRESLPIMLVTEDTYTVAARLQTLRPTMVAEDHDKLHAALALFERFADMEGIDRKLSRIESPGMTPRMFTYNLVQQARARQRHIVLPEGEEPRILRAAAELVERGIVKLTLLGRPEQIGIVLVQQGIALAPDTVEIIDPAVSPHLEAYANTYFELRRHKGVTLDTARDCMLDVSYFGTMMVYLGHADGMVSGAIHTTQHTIRPALQIIKTRPGVSVVSSVFFMCLDDGVVVYGDCAVNPDPTAQQLAEIAISSADTAKIFGLAPKVALLSYSSGDSGSGSEVEKVRDATRLARSLRPDLELEGPIQYDAAVDAGVAALKMPNSAVAGHATVFVFPDLNTGNNTYKAVQRETGAMAIGPILQGLCKPVNDLSRGCSVDDIINTVVITALQAGS